MHRYYINNINNLLVAREGIEPPPRGFSAADGVVMGLVINHLHRLPPLFPGAPRHNPGTPNLSWSHFWHKANETRDLVEDDGALAQDVVHCNT